MYEAEGRTNAIFVELEMSNKKTTGGHYYINRILFAFA